MTGLVYQRYDESQQRPGVVVWFYVYIILMAVLYGLFLLVGSGLAIAAASGAFPPQDQTPVMVMGIFYGGLGLVFMTPFLIPFFVQPRKWVWIYGIVLIALGMTSICFLPFLIPLLIFWCKPEVRGWYEDGNLVRK